jgi:hypothetical protein
MFLLKLNAKTSEKKPLSIMITHILGDTFSVLTTAVLSSVTDITITATNEMTTVVFTCIGGI